MLRLRRLYVLRRARLRQALLGTLGACLLILAMTGGLVLMGPAESWPTLIGWAVGSCAVLALLLVSTPWQRMPSLALLVIPAVWLLSLGVARLLIGPQVGNFSGMIVIAFLFAGLTQQRHHSWWLMLLAIPVWYLMVCDNGGVSQIPVRLPIALLSWFCVAEVTAARTSRLQREIRQLGHDVDSDALTGLANRRVLADLLRTARPGDALVLLDLDHFKRINDTLGHQAGDAVLARVGLLVNRQVGLSDLALRYGGEEILVLLSSADQRKLRRFDSALREDLTALEPPISFSAGVALITEGEQPEVALRRADAALYAVKGSGRGRTGGDLVTDHRGDEPHDSAGQHPGARSSSLFPTVLPSTMPDWISPNSAAITHDAF